jgi:hypothetical protein
MLYKKAEYRGRPTNLHNFVMIRRPFIQFEFLLSTHLLGCAFLHNTELFTRLLADTPVNGTIPTQIGQLKYLTYMYYLFRFMS